MTFGHKLGAASPAFLGRFIDNDGVPETSPIELFPSQEF